MNGKQELKFSHRFVLLPFSEYLRLTTNQPAKIRDNPLSMPELARSKETRADLNAGTFVEPSHLTYDKILEQTQKIESYLSDLRKLREGTRSLSAPSSQRLPIKREREEDEDDGEQMDFAEQEPPIKREAKDVFGTPGKQEARISSPLQQESFATRQKLTPRSVKSRKVDWMYEELARQGLLTKDGDVVVKGDDGKKITFKKSSVPDLMEHYLTARPDRVGTRGQEKFKKSMQDAGIFTDDYTPTAERGWDSLSDSELHTGSFDTAQSSLKSSKPKPIKSKAEFSDQGGKGKWISVRM